MPDHLQTVLPSIKADDIKALMVALAKVRSPLTPLMEAEPQLRAFIDTAVEPRLRDMGIVDIRRDAMGNLLAAFGANKTGRSLMLVTNAMNQPAATMPNPYGGEVRDGAAYGLPGEVVLGKGVSEQKAPLAAILVALRAVLAAKVPLIGQVVFLCCTSGETGRHDAIKSIIEATGARAEMAIVNGTGNRISLGNRGRVDATIVVHGSPGHSSRPASACNAVTGALEVMRRLTEMRFVGSHPALGQPTLAVNRIRSFPESTHTIQDRCEIGIDRRLLPGEDPDAAIAELAAIAASVDGMKDPVSGKPWRVELIRGPFMYPSLVADSCQLVRSLIQASQAAVGAPPELYYQSNAFDQGYLNHIGIETCAYGPGEDKYAHTDLDMASVSRTCDAAKVYAALILQRLV
jgi:acetylornithine deacetylase/succinyl-diaminopimelate desuccinylase-like protein